MHTRFPSVERAKRGEQTTDTFAFFRVEDMDRMLVQAHSFFFA